jgi:guanylate kinase
MKLPQTKKLFVLSSPSGGGKTTLGKHLLKQMPRLVRSVSMTTRPPRKGEKDKRDYFFVNENQFAQLKKKKGFLEDARVFGYAYGTPQNYVAKELTRGNDVLLLIDVQGALQVKKQCRNAILVFVEPPSLKELKLRLVKRSTDKAESIRLRLKMAEREMQYRRHYNYVVKNKDLKHAINEIEAIFIAERLKS